MKTGIERANQQESGRENMHRERERQRQTDRQTERQGESPRAFELDGGRGRVLKEKDMEGQKKMHSWTKRNIFVYIHIT